MKAETKLFRISVIIVLLLYGVGVIGFNTSFKDLMISLTPYTLIISFVLVLLNHKKWGRFFMAFLAFSLSFGFFIEVLGVEFGFIFGQYSYGATLGYKIFDVPVLIGVNWFVLSYSSGMIANLFNVRKVIKVLIGAFLMVLLDVSLEPVAVAFDFWTWEGGIIPLRNYIAWFVVALIIHYFFQDLKLKKINKLAVILFIVQWVFFFILSLNVES